MASYEEYLNQITKSQQDSLNKDIDEIKKQKDTQVGIVKENYGQQIEDTEESYTDLHRENSVQKLLNIKSIREGMANMGLTDSGLSRSQLTAANLSYANQKGELDRNMQKAVDGLAMEMNARITELESNASAAEQEIRSTYNANARSQAQTMYNNWVSEQVAIEKARIEAEKNSSANKRIEYKQLVSDIYNGEMSKESILYSIYDYVITYDLDVDESSYTNGEINSLLGEAGISNAEWKSYWQKQHGIIIQNSSDISEVKSFEERTWTKTKETRNGLLNLGDAWTKSVDWNDEVTDEYGNKYTLRQLKTKGASDQLLKQLTFLKNIK